MAETKPKIRRDNLENAAQSHIVPENDEGNKEYKLKLLNSSPERIEQTMTQMRYRIQEGDGEAFYTLGVTDSGGVIGLSDEEYKKSKEILDIIAQKSNYTLTLISEHNVDDTKKMYEFLVREKNPIKYVDVRIACAGHVDAGKSSLLGVLLSGTNDNGRGAARLHVFNFQHEVKTGRTSSVAQHILGFDSSGNPVNYGDAFGRPKTWPEIVQHSSKIVTFFDLCGHEKYLKTTILGLTSQSPDLVFILVGGNMGMSKMTKEHIFLCLSLHIPFVVIITKIDICKDRANVLEDTVSEVKQLIKAPGIRRIPYDIRSPEDVMICVKNINGNTTVPFFYVSNVTGEGIDNVRSFLNLFTKKGKSEVNENKLEYHVDQTFQVTGVGTVIGGQLINGKIKIGDKLLVGPENGEYVTIQVRSIHCKRVGLDEVDSGRYVCIGVKKPESLTIRRGHVIISPVDKPVHVEEFDAEIVVLKSHSTTIKPGYEPVVHTGSIRQTARIISITNKQCARNQTDTDETVLRTGDRATVRFKFCYKPEYVRKGSRLLLAEGRVKIIGKIIGVTEKVLNIV